MFNVDPVRTSRAKGADDAAVIDVMLPKLDGLALIAQLRAHKVSTPVIILSARRSVDERVEGLQSGGDDYLTKPFALSELIARVQALIRRGAGTVEPASLTMSDLTLDLRSREVERGGGGSSFSGGSSLSSSTSCGTRDGLSRKR